MTEIEFAKRIFVREYPGAMAALVLNELAGAALVLVGLGTAIPFIAGLLGGRGELPEPLGALMTALGLEGWSNVQILELLAGLMFIRILLDAVRLYIAGWIGVRLNRTIKTRMNNAMASADWERFSGIDQGKYMQCLVSESSLARGAVSDLASAFAYGLITVLLLGWMAVYSFNMFMIFVFFGAVFMWTNRRLMRLLHQTSRERITLMSQMNTRVTDVRHVFKFLLAENLAKTMAEGISRMINWIASVERRQLLLAVLADNYVAFFGLLIVTGVTLAHFLLYGGNGAALLFDLILLQRIASYFGNFQTKRKSMLQKIPSYEACLEMMHLAGAPLVAGRTAEAIGRLEKGIVVENATYSFASDRPALRGVSMQLPPKGMVFFIGPSGSGKTTLVDMILGLLKPGPGGCILVDGKDLNDLDADSWSRQVAYVPQEAYILSGKLRDYLTFGIEGVREEKIWEALERADAARLVRALPDGLDTLVRQGGGGFSGGERQRLSIARALVREVKVLILDEPSSSIDKASERAIFGSLKALADDMLIIVVTHSRDVIRGMDHLYQFDRGRLVWRGNHTQWLKREHGASRT